MGVVFEFEKLEVYQAGREFRRRINKLAALLPKYEEYRLKIQMRKASLCITNCLAEGHGRYTFKDRVHYCYEARGSLQELVDDIGECCDCNYAKPEHLEDLREDAHRLLQLIDGYSRYLRREHEKRAPKSKTRNKSR